MSATGAAVPPMLSAVRHGAAHHLGPLLDGYRPYLLAVARGQSDAALKVKAGDSDVVQEALLEAYRTFPHFRGQTDAELRAWLRQILVHHVATVGRRFRGTRKRQVGAEVPLAGDRRSYPGMAAPTASPSGAAIERECRHMLTAAIDRLPADYRRVILLRYQDGRSFAEVAVEMGRSVNAVELLWLRAVERVKRELGLCRDPG